VENPGGRQIHIQKFFARFDRDILFYSLVISACVALAYSNTFSVPFIFDDQNNIVDNISIRNLLSVSQLLAPPLGMGISGRPVVNLTLALNYAISGENPWSYHFLNILIHLSAALCLFGIMRRTFLSDSLKLKYVSAATSLAFACALLWARHPLQTQAVTYTIQRCESLMGLCFLLTFYFAIRGWQSDAKWQWHLAAILSFLVGIGTKEVIIVAPILLFSYDLIFVHHSVRDVLRQSRLLYVGLIFGLLILKFLVAAGGTASSGTGNIPFSALDYWITQPEVILHYLQLTIWPYPLSLDYDWPITKLRDAWPAIITIAVLITVSVWMLLKRQPIGFWASWFFAILAPTSLMPLPDIAFEHRMYLPSIAIVVITITVFYRMSDAAINRWIKSEAVGSMIICKGFIYFLILAVPALGILTYARNIDYSSDVSIWTAVVRNHPENSRAHANLGNALLQEGHPRKALGPLYRALYIETRNAHRYQGALTYYEYLSIRTVYAKVQDNIGWILLMNGKAMAADKHFQEVLKVNPNNAVALGHVGVALYFLGEQEASKECFRRAILLKASDPDIVVNYGVTLRLQGRRIEAMEQFQRALQLMPYNLEAHYGLGMVLRQMGREAEAARHFQLVLQLNPKYVPAQNAMEQTVKKQKRAKMPL
jgi:protein O-mannosyl-transferase